MSGTPVSTAVPPPSVPFYARLHWQILAAMVLGATLGFTIGEPAETWLGWMGVLFVRLLRMIIVPLIFSSIVSGVSSVGGGRTLGRLGIKTMSFYLVSSLLAILMGLVLVNAIQPGQYVDRTDLSGAESADLKTPTSLLEIFIRLIPLNPVAAAASGDMLGIIFFAIILGVGVTQLPARSRNTMQELFGGAFELMMVVTRWIMRLLPLGVLGLITRAAAQSGADEIRGLAMYMVTIALGLTLHVVITLPLLLYLVGRMNPMVHVRNMMDALLTAFSTSSSSATLPVTMRSVEKKVGVSNKVSSFVLPMGATINMDGTALYECVGVIFISQVLGHELSFLAQIVVVFTALLASIGAAGIPSAGLVVIFIVTDAVNLRGPEVDLLIGMLLAIDRPLDMYRTMVNVFSDSSGAAIIARTEGESHVNAA